MPPSIDNINQSTKKRTHYTFHSTQTPESPSPSQSKFTFFYQIGSCKDPKTNTYPMRKFVIDSNNNFADVRSYNLTSKQNKNFYILYKPHQYKVYSVTSLDNINPPSFFDINTSNSSILTNDYSYSGNFAPF